MTAISAIAFGSALVASSNAVWHSHVLKWASIKTKGADAWRFGSEILAAEMASGWADLQALAGLAAMILGILAVVGINAGVLTLVALLVLGATVVSTGSALSGAVLSFMGPSAEPAAQIPAARNRQARHLAPTNRAWNAGFPFRAYRGRAPD